MASYSPFHTLLQLLVFAVTSNSCCWCSSLEMFTGLSPVVPRASHTPPKWNLQPPPPRSSTPTGQSNQMAGGDQSVERWEGNQPKVTSVSGGQAKPGCAGCRTLEPRMICSGSLVPLSQRADSDQDSSPKTELAQIPRFLAHYLHFVMLMFICP